jgi:hypothetical protein
MNRTVAVAVAVAAALALLALAPAADAKGLIELVVCSPQRCVDRTALVHRSANPDAVLGGEPVSESSVIAEPFVRVLAGMGERDHSAMYGRTAMRFLPVSGLLLTDQGIWNKLSRDGAATLRAASRGLARYPARRLHLAPPSRPAAAFRGEVPVRHAGNGGVTPAIPATAAGVAALLAGGALLRRRRRPPATGARAAV